MHTRSDAEIFFFRESNGSEIDLIVDRKTARDHVEIKSGFTFRPEMAKMLFRHAPEADHSWVVYRGREIELGDGVGAVNVASYLASSSGP